MSSSMSRRPAASLHTLTTSCSVYFVVLHCSPGRVYAENALGAGAPSKPVEVDLYTFLGHLRAQEDGGKSTTPTDDASAPTPTSTSSALAGPQLRSPHHPTPATVPSLQPCTLVPAPEFVSPPDIIIPAHAKDTVSLHSKSLGVSERPAELRIRVEPSNKKKERKKLAKGLTKELSLLQSPPAAFGGDFMGLSGYGEARVHGLFAPPSSHREERRRAPAADSNRVVVVDPKKLPHHGDRRSDGGLYPLPPIVIASGISGDRRGGGGGTAEVKPGTITTQNCRWWGAAERRGHGNLGGSTSCSNNNNKNDDMFHAFLNLDRPLPGRLRRDREG